MRDRNFNVSATFWLTRRSACRLWMRASGSSSVVGRLANIGVKIVGSSVANRESSPRFVRDGDPVNAEWDKSQEFQLEMHKLTNDISSTG